MSMTLDGSILTIAIPNSEASVKAQHKGIKDRSVGQYYMSELQNEIISFLNVEKTTFYIDFMRVSFNMKCFIELIKSSNMESIFKGTLEPQIAALKTIDWLLIKDSGLHQIEAPLPSKSNKYLKFNLFDDYFTIFRDLCLGEFTNILLKQISNDCILITVKSNGVFEDKLAKGELAKLLS